LNQSEGFHAACGKGGSPHLFISGLA